MSGRRIAIYKNDMPLDVNIDHSTPSKGLAAELVIWLSGMTAFFASRQCQNEHAFQFKRHTADRMSSVDDDSE
jgi:hypothetical protein